MTPMGPENFRKNLMLLSSDFISDGYLGFNQGQHTTKKRKKTPPLLL
jgi:hypothetical protein